MPTSIHRKVRAAQAGENPSVIARLPSGWVVLGNQQAMRGYAILLRDPVVPNLNALSPAERQQFLLDMSLIGDAVLQVTGARLINYMILGNQDPALHAHVCPRYAEEPDELRTAGPWVYWPPYPQLVFEEERDRALIAQLAAALAPVAL